jgi:hypothetical protein
MQAMRPMGRRKEAAEGARFDIALLQESRCDRRLQCLQRFRGF